MSNTNRNREDEKHTAAGEESGMAEWMKSIEEKIDRDNARRNVETVETDDGEIGPKYAEDDPTLGE